MKKLILSLIVPFLFSTLNAQMSVDNKEVYVWFDTAIGVENSGLYVGKEYKENFKFKNNKHKFFEFNGFQKGDLIYDGQPYFNVSLKLDVFENEFFIIDSLTKVLPNSFIEILKFDEGIIKYKLESLRDLNDDELESTRPNQLIKVPYIKGVAKNNLVRVVS